MYVLPDGSFGVPTNLMLSDSSRNAKIISWWLLPRQILIYAVSRRVRCYKVCLTYPKTPVRHSLGKSALGEYYVPAGKMGSLFEALPIFRGGYVDMVCSGRSEQPGSYFVRVAGQMGEDGFVVHRATSDCASPTVLTINTRKATKGNE